MKENTHTKFMDESREFPTREQVVASPELMDRIDAARAEILMDGMDPEAVAARNIAEMGFFKALGETMKPHMKKLKEINGKQFKAQIAAAISVIPFVGEGKSFLGIAGFKKGLAAAKEAKVAKGTWGAVREGFKARKAFEVAEANARLVTLAKTNPFIQAEVRAGERIKALTQASKDIAKFEGVGVFGKMKMARELGKATKAVKKEELALAYKLAQRGARLKGANNFEAPIAAFALRHGTKASEAMHTFQGREGVKGFFNLTPDVPHWLSLTTAVGEMVGLHGIDMIPAVLQMGKNTIDMIATYGKLTKDVWNLCADRISGKHKDLRKQVAAFEPKMAPAAA